MFLTFGEVMVRVAPESHLRWRQAVPGRVEVTWGGGEANDPRREQTKRKTRRPKRRASGKK